MQLGKGTNADVKTTSCDTQLELLASVLTAINAISHFDYYKAINVKSIGHADYTVSQHDYRLLSYAYVDLTWENIVTYRIFWWVSYKVVSMVYVLLSVHLPPP